MTDQFLNRKEAANYLTSLGCPVSAQRLAFYAMQNNERGGPPFTKIKGFTVRYVKTDLEIWAKANTKRIE